MAVNVQPQFRNLSDVINGAVCRVESVTASSDHVARLAGLGVSVGRQIRVLRTGEPTVVQVYGSRLGLARSLARTIFVTVESNQDQAAE